MLGTGWLKPWRASAFAKLRIGMFLGLVVYAMPTAFILWIISTLIHFAELLEKLDLLRTKFVVISKSGGTAETLMQAMATFEALEKSGFYQTKYLNMFRHHRTDGWKTNPLRHFLTHNIIFRCLNLILGLAGVILRLQMLGLLPAAIVGLDIDKIRAGAKTVLISFSMQKLRTFLLQFPLHFSCK